MTDVLIYDRLPGNTGAVECAGRVDTRRGPQAVRGPATCRIETQHGALLDGTGYLRTPSVSADRRTRTLSTLRSIITEFAGSRAKRKCCYCPYL